MEATITRLAITALAALAAVSVAASDEPEEGGAAMSETATQPASAPEPAPATQPGEAPTAGTPADVAPYLAKFDQEWKERDRPDSLAAARAALDEAERLAPKSFDVLAREARYYAWISDDTSLSTHDRSVLGKKGWQFAEEALKLEPDRVEGHFYAAANMGNYALGIGVLKALTQGIEGKFKEQLSRAEQIDPTFDWGTIYNAWGRFWYELPWPKYSAKKSEEALRKALRVNPASARARVYLADLFIKEGKKEQARNVLNDVVTSPPGSYDPPEARRMQARAREILQKLR